MVTRSATPQLSRNVLIRVSAASTQTAHVTPIQKRHAIDNLNEHLFDMSEIIIHIRAQCKSAATAQCILLNGEFTKLCYMYMY